MQVRAFKFPPLPSRKNTQGQASNRISKKLQHHSRRQQSSSGKRQFLYENKQNSTDNAKRPSSARSINSVSKQQNKSCDSKYSRGSSRQRSIDLEKRDRANYNVKTRMSMPSISAKSWVIYEMKQAKYIYGKRIFKKREVASLTKIMNLISILELIDQLQLNPHQIKVKVSRDASCIVGTTASLKHDMQITLYDLYFGMMLPSGNDAAYQIAQIGGALLIMLKTGIKTNIIYDIDLFTEYYQKQQNTVRIYLSHMNRISKRLGMLNSNFANPHGLSNTDNYSCAQDMSKLSIYSMENQTFREVVRTKIYEKNYIVKIEIDKQIEIQEQSNFQLKAPPKLSALEKEYFRDQIMLRWQNTNKMLKMSWSGIKTGITPNAGPCLAASVQKSIGGRNLEFLVILISSSSMQKRWKEVAEIVNWVIEQKMYY